MPKQTTTEKAAATPAKKTASRKKVVFTLQFAGKELTVAEMEALAVAAWMEQTGGLKKDAKDIQLYAKPEDSMLYYVINGESGSVALQWNQQTTQKPVCGFSQTGFLFLSCCVLLLKLCSNGDFLLDTESNVLHRQQHRNRTILFRNFDVLEVQHGFFCCQYRLQLWAVRESSSLNLRDTGRNHKQP